MAGAILSATKKITRLTKNDSNEADSYSFVGIDDYYEQVALKIAKEEGLIWHLAEMPELEQRFQDVYQDWHIRKVFEVTIELGDQDRSGYRFSVVSVTMPYDGATNTGKMLSYADKAFMRQLFKIPTGEPDVDGDAAVTKSEQSQQKNADKKEEFFGNTPTGHQTGVANVR